MWGLLGGYVWFQGHVSLLPGFVRRGDAMPELTEFFYIGVDQYGCTYEGTVWHFWPGSARWSVFEVLQTNFVYFKLVA